MKKYGIGLFVLVVGVLPMVLFASQEKMHSRVKFRPLTAEEVERFHGHLGPMVVLGVRIGEHAVTERKIPRYFGLTVRVECPAKPPATCILDGLQQSTGATMGKKNIEHIIADDIKVTITDTDTGKQVTYRIKESTQALLKQWGEEGLDVEEQGHRLFRMKAEHLFDME
jgi:formylmethanofuran dehydrogenase subunit E